MFASASQQGNPGYVGLYPLPLETPAQTPGPSRCQHRAPSSAPRAAEQAPLALRCSRGGCTCQSFSASPPPASTWCFSTSVSLALPCKQAHLHHLSRFHSYVLTWHLFFSFCLTSHCMTNSGSIYIIAGILKPGKPFQVLLSGFHFCSGFSIIMIAIIRLSFNN